MPLCVLPFCNCSPDRDIEGKLVVLLPHRQARAKGELFWLGRVKKGTVVDKKAQIEYLKVRSTYNPRLFCLENIPANPIDTKMLLDDGKEFPSYAVVNVDEQYGQWEASFQFVDPRYIFNF